jgi:osmotically-inducible protein OsmY
MMQSSQLQRNVLAELDWDPRVNVAKVGVTVDDGVVTLTGTVDSYADKLAAEKVVKRVVGVRGVANDLSVTLPSTAKRSDTDLAKAAIQILDWDVRIPQDGITVTVKDGWVTLEGEVEWNFQREDAGKAVRRLKGVIGVSNMITVKSHLKATDVKTKIEEALRRNAEIDAQHIKVGVDGSKVVLTGTVRSWAERRDAEHAAWAARGVSKVENRIGIEHEAIAGYPG